MSLKYKYESWLKANPKLNSEISFWDFIEQFDKENPIEYKKHVLSNEFTKHAFWLKDGWHFCIHEFNNAKDFLFHDHTGDFYSFIIEGWYDEEILNNNGTSNIFNRCFGEHRFVKAKTIHRIIEVCPTGCKTLVIPKENVQPWSFFKIENGQIYQRIHNQKEFKLYKQ